MSAGREWCQKRNGAIDFLNNTSNGSLVAVKFNAAVLTPEVEQELVAAANTLAQRINSAVEEGLKKQSAAPRPSTSSGGERFW